MKLSGTARMPFVRVYFRETQELVFDAHDKAFRFYGGVCRRGIYDNMKTAVRRSSSARRGRYNPRFLQMCSHHLIEPVACTPCVGMGEGSGREPGRQSARPNVPAQAAGKESSPSSVRWLEDQCIAYAQRDPTS